LDNRRRAREAPFPRLVQREAFLLAARNGEFQSCVVEPIDQEVVDKQFAPFAKFNRGLGCR
jgi:hypothetical protein